MISEPVPATDAVRRIRAGSQGPSLASVPKVYEPSLPRIRSAEPVTVIIASGGSSEAAVGAGIGRLLGGRPVGGTSVGATCVGASRVTAGVGRTGGADVGPGGGDAPVDVGCGAAGEPVAVPAGGPSVDTVAGFAVALPDRGGIRIGAVLPPHAATSSTTRIDLAERHMPDRPEMRVSGDRRRPWGTAEGCIHRR